MILSVNVVSYNKEIRTVNELDPINLEGNLTVGRNERMKGLSSELYSLLEGKAHGEFKKVGKNYIFKNYRKSFVKLNSFLVRTLGRFFRYAGVAPLKRYQEIGLSEGDEIIIKFDNKELVLGVVSI